MRKAATSPGIAGNDLNRCDAPALQYKIRAKSKRTAVFFADSRLRDFEMGSGGQKRVALDGNKKGLCERKLLVCGKGKLFQLMQSYPIKKSIFQHT